MTAKEVCDLISSVGFPIVMCGALIYYIINVKGNSGDEEKAEEIFLEVVNFFC